MSKKGKTNSFAKALRENQKKINVMVEGWEEEKSLAEVTEETVNGIIATPISGMIPVTITEAVENALNDLPYLAISTLYTEAVYSAYELGMKNLGKRQTLIVPLTADAADDPFVDQRFSSVIDVLQKNTNIGLVLDEMPKKVFKKVRLWAEDENAGRMFIIRIPNLMMFHDNIVKGKTATPVLFDLVVLFTNATSKALRKAKKKSPDDFKDFTTDFVKDTISVVRNFGASSVHIPLWQEFYPDEYEAARIWAAQLTDDANKVQTLKRLVFSTTDPNYLISFNQETARIINGDEGNGMRVV